MRRWFLALFALHFWVLGAAFAFGHGDLQPQPRAWLVSEVMAQTDTAALSADGDTLDRAAPEHVLADAQPELPEGLSPGMHAGLPVMIPPAPTGFRQPPPVLPWVDRLERPPRGALTLA